MVLMNFTLGRLILEVPFLVLYPVDYGYYPVRVYIILPTIIVAIVVINVRILAKYRGQHDFSVKQYAVFIITIPVLVSWFIHAILVVLGLLGVN
jgi:hypothetical protein